PSGVPIALPADHDDDVCGIVRRDADRTWGRCRFRAAPAARHRDCRRAGAFTMADAVHDTSDLSLPGTPLPLARPALPAVARAGGPHRCPETSSGGGPSWRRVRSPNWYGPRSGRETWQRRG